MAHKHEPKAVKTDFSETIPERTRRKSRLLAKPGVPGVRLKVEELLHAHHGIDERALRRLDAKGRDILRRMAHSPSAPDYPTRREAVSALAALRDPESTAVMVTLAMDDNEDEVIIGRALDGLARVGGSAAEAAILRRCESKRTFVRNRALQAAVALGKRRLIPVIQRAAAEHPSQIIRAQAGERLTALKVAVPKSRVQVKVPKRKISRE